MNRTIAVAVMVVGLVGLTLVVVGIVVPQCLPVRRFPHRVSACMSNLWQIDGAKDQAGMEKGLTNGTVVMAADLDPYIPGGTKTVRCPNDPQKSFATSYSVEPLGKPPRCKIHPDRHSISVGDIGEG